MRAIAIAALLAFAGCGYRLAGEGAVPEGAHTVAIKPFANHTREVGLEVRLQRAIEDEFRRRGSLRVAQDESADLVLSGDIRRFTNSPVAFSATDEAVQYQGVMQVGIKLVDRRTKQVVRQVDALQAAQDFGAVSGTVVATSPHFQRGTIDARDLPSLTNVQIGLTRRREAVADLIDQIARDIYSQAMEGF
jgi:hypothetical protein